MSTRLGTLGSPDDGREWIYRGLGVAIRAGEKAGTGIGEVETHSASSFLLLRGERKHRAV